MSITAHGTSPSNSCIKVLKLLGHSLCLAPVQLQRGILTRVLTLCFTNYLHFRQGTFPGGSQPRGTTSCFSSGLIRLSLTKGRQQSPPGGNTACGLHRSGPAPVPGAGAAPTGTAGSSPIPRYAGGFSRSPAQPHPQVRRGGFPAPRPRRVASPQTHYLVRQLRHLLLLRAQGLRDARRSLQTQRTHEPPPGRGRGGQPARAKRPPPWHRGTAQCPLHGGRHLLSARPQCTAPPGHPGAAIFPPIGHNARR